MKVYFSLGQNNFLNTRRVHQSIARQAGIGNSLPSAKSEPKDIVTITPQGKANSILAGLIQQKMAVAESKSALITETLEKGGTLDSVKSQLKAYEEQLKNIYEQISHVMAQEIEDRSEKMKPKYDHKPKTGNELQDESLAGIVSLSGDLRHVKTVRAVKAGVDSDSHILKSEIALDKAYADLSQGALKAKVEHKEAKLADMEQRSLYLASKIADKLSAISEKAADQPQEAIPESQNERLISETMNGNSWGDSADGDAVKE